MEKLLKLTYYHNSGFSVQAGSTLLVFDYWEGEGRCLPISTRIDEKFLRAFEKIYVFVSHEHMDHFDTITYEWADHGLPVQYIAAAGMPDGTRGTRMEPLQEKQLSPDIHVKAFDSTDLGVSFLVTAYGMTIFHAGDLNLWHWREESTLREIAEAEQAFYKALEPLKEHRIDLAMFPLDPRQGSHFDAGANHFVLTHKPKVFVPMHWQGRSEVAIDYARRSRNPNTEVLALTRPGTIANLTFGENELDIHIIEPPKDPEDYPRPLRSLGDDSSNPFADSDMPVKL